MLNPAQPPITLGETFALGIPFGPLSITGSCRIIGVVDEPEAYGFGFSTLGHHAWSAEQSLVVTNIDGNPSVTATVAWAPTIVGSKLIPPLTRYLIGRYVMGILEGIAEAEVAELHYRMQEIVQQVPVPKTYRVPEVVEEPEIVFEEPKPETGAELLDRYENSWPPNHLGFCQTYSAENARWAQVVFATVGSLRRIDGLCEDCFKSGVAWVGGGVFWFDVC